MFTTFLFYILHRYVFLYHPVHVATRMTGILKRPVLLSLTSAKKRNLGNAYEVTGIKSVVNLKTKYLRTFYRSLISIVHAHGSAARHPQFMQLFVIM